MKTQHFTRDALEITPDRRLRPCAMSPSRHVEVTREPIFEHAGTFLYRVFEPATEHVTHYHCLPANPDRLIPGLVGALQHRNMPAGFLYPAMNHTQQFASERVKTAFERGNQELAYAYIMAEFPEAAAGVFDRGTIRVKAYATATRYDDNPLIDIKTDDGFLQISPGWEDTMLRFTGQACCQTVNGEESSLENCLLEYIHAANLIQIDSRKPAEVHHV